jgi:predicted MFS family arabinose efflux permease
MELGIGLGAFISGILYDNNAEHFLLTFGICAVLAGVAFLYLQGKRHHTGI